MNQILPAPIKTFHRFKRIMADAPWSNHDLLVAIILLFIGLCLLIDPEVGKLLRSMTYLDQQWGIVRIATLFTAAGAICLSVTLWCAVPPFLLRLLSRMLGAFCFLLLAFSTAMFSLWTPSSITYFMIAFWSFWGILRTNSSGR